MYLCRQWLSAQTRKSDQEHDLLLHKLLEIVPTARLVYCVNALWIIDVLDQVPQLAGCVPRQPRESRFFPEAGQKVEILCILTAVAAGTSWPHGVPRHDMDGRTAEKEVGWATCRSAEISACKVEAGGTWRDTMLKGERSASLKRCSDRRVIET